METDSEMRQLIIAYILANDVTFAKTNFANYSLTQLVIIKSGLEVKNKFNK